jgi:RimJ/RimL family protein N-acetyltransferase
MSKQFTTKDNRTVWLRPAVEDDAEAIIRAVDMVAREGRYFLRSRFEHGVEQERAFLTQTAEQGNLFLLALLDDLLVGWVTLFRAPHEFRRHTAELGIGVLRAYRGIGIGEVLMDQALRWAAGQGIEKVTLGVRAGNERAQALYHKLGFVEEGCRVRDVKDQNGRYDDTIEMSYFVPQAPGEVR